MTKSPFLIWKKMIFSEIIDNADLKELITDFGDQSWVSAGRSHHRKTRIGLDICENWVANFRRFGECKMPMQQHTNSRTLIKIWKC